MQPVAPQVRSDPAAVDARGLPVLAARPVTAGGEERPRAGGAARRPLEFGDRVERESGSLGRRVFSWVPDSYGHCSSLVSQVACIFSKHFFVVSEFVGGSIFSAYRFLQWWPRAEIFSLKTQFLTELAELHVPNLQALAEYYRSLLPNDDMSNQLPGDPS